MSLHLILRWYLIMKKLAKKDCNKNIFISEGNKKLVENKTEYFLIWSIPSVITCPWRTPQCEKLCYAKKAEVLYPEVLPCRTRNYEESKKDNFIQDMNLWLQWHLSRPSKQGKQCYFRIHESGDFMNSEYLAKFITIAQNNPTIIFMAYTKSVNLLIPFENCIPANLIIRYSIWEDTKQEQLDNALDMGLPIYTAFTKEVIGYKVAHEGYTLCECDCKNCKMCYSNKVDKIAVCIH